MSSLLENFQTRIGFFFLIAGFFFLQTKIVIIIFNIIINIIVIENSNEKELFILGWFN
jgi:hypothetical protein